MTDAKTRVTVPVDEQRVREIVREELGIVDKPANDEGMSPMAQFAAAVNGSTALELWEADFLNFIRSKGLGITPEMQEAIARGRRDREGLNRLADHLSPEI